MLGYIEDRLKAAQLQHAFNMGVCTTDCDAATAFVHCAVKETGLTVVAPLHDVDRNLWHIKTRFSR